MVTPPRAEPRRRVALAPHLWFGRDRPDRGRLVEGQAWGRTGGGVGELGGKGESPYGEFIVRPTSPHVLGSQ